MDTLMDMGTMWVWMVEFQFGRAKTNSVSPPLMWAEEPANALEDLGAAKIRTNESGLILTTGGEHHLKYKRFTIFYHIC